MQMFHDHRGMHATPDVPEHAMMPPLGIFKRVQVGNHHPVINGRVIYDATMPDIVELTLDDGRIIVVMPDGGVYFYGNSDSRPYKSVRA